jgi:hypothetical protein
MAASTAPQIKAALLTLLRADSGLSGVQCEYSDPGDAIQQESLFYGRTIESEQPSSYGQRKQRESYDIELYIYVATDSNDPQTCEERCWALIARLETVVRANNSNTGALSTAMTNGAGWVAMAGITTTPFRFNGQCVTEGLCRVHVEAVK